MLQEEDPEKKCKLKILEDLQGSPERSLNRTRKYASRSTAKTRVDRTARDSSKDDRSHTIVQKGCQDGRGMCSLPIFSAQMKESFEIVLFSTHLHPGLMLFAQED